MIFKFLMFLIACYGICNQLIYNDGPFKIWYYLRLITNKINSQLGYLFTCMICLPTWVGIMFTLINYFLLLPIKFTPGTIILDGNFLWLAIIIDGAIASGGVWLIHTIQEYFEKDDYIIEEKETKNLLND